MVSIYEINNKVKDDLGNLFDSIKEDLIDNKPIFIGTKEEVEKFVNKNNLENYKLSLK